MSSIFRAVAGEDDVRSEYFALGWNIDAAIESLESTLIEERRRFEVKEQEVAELRNLMAELTCSTTQPNNLACEERSENSMSARMAQQQAEHDAKLAALQLTLAKEQQRADAAESALAVEVERNASLMRQLRDAEAHVSMAGSGQASIVGELEAALLALHSQVQDMKKDLSEREVEMSLLKHELERAGVSEGKGFSEGELEMTFSKQDNEAGDTKEKKLAEVELRVVKLEAELGKELALRKAAQEEAITKAQELRELQDTIGDPWSTACEEVQTSSIHDGDDTELLNSDRPRRPSQSPEPVATAIPNVKVGKAVAVNSSGGGSDMQSIAMQSPTTTTRSVSPKSFQKAPAATANTTNFPKEISFLSTEPSLEVVHV
mmetsp:Transcript_63105/g.137133  ORF Transcript_63105/g.137133 Transcript_63105/m.137133 type:complete len:376 (+) Transcript_63105:74-1201(+)